MKNTIDFLISKEHEGKKIREYLKDTADLSTRMMRGAALDKRIKVNNCVVKLNYVLKDGDNISVILDKKEDQDIQPEPIDIDIVYEDKDILVVNKPPYMVVHPTRSHPTGTLANGILYYFRQTKQACIVRLVSRLDMNTSGLIVIAKNQFSHMALSKDTNKEKFEKTYLAIVHGNMDLKEGTIDLSIYRPEEDRIKRVVDERGQRSITHYKVIESLPCADVLELKLETGRTHQIRVHLSHLGHPILGDTLYGTEDEALIGRQALHAFRLKFPNPRTGEMIELEAPMPEDMQKCQRDVSFGTPKQKKF